MPRPHVRARLLTARGTGGVAVVALEGPGRLELARSLVGTLPAESAPVLRWLSLAGERVDQALVLVRPQCVELHVHGSQAVLGALESALGQLEVDEPTAVECLLRGAASLPQLDFALEQQRLRRRFDGSFTAWLAAHRDAPEALREALAGFERARALASPCRIVLMGRKNAGKSTLMNRLLFRERVLAGARPGLTRDPVHERVALADYPYELIDTAGEGEALDALDREAIARGRAARAGGLPVLVVDAVEGVGAIERALWETEHPMLVVRTKMDLGAAPWPADLPGPAVDVSCRDAESAPRVRRAVGEALRQLRGLPVAGPAGRVVAVSPEEAAAVAAALAAS